MKAKDNPFKEGSWEHAAYEAAAMFTKDFVIPHGPVSISFMEELHGYTEGFKHPANICEFGRHAWAGYYHTGGNKTITQIVEFVAGKQHDYGNDNILKWGAEGITIRTWDKLARIRNLEKRGGGSANEPLSDAWFDCLGYAIVAYMLLLGTFTRPLQADMIDPEPTPVSEETANLGLATTRELLNELRARIEVDGRLDYRTVDGR
jgi:hypothetical protein